MTRKIYVPWPLDDRVSALMANARRTNAKRDADERALGLAAASDEPPAECLQTALCALFAGLTKKDWSCIAEGIAMVQDVERILPK